MDLNFISFELSVKLEEIGFIPKSIFGAYIKKGTGFQFISPVEMAAWQGKRFTILCYAPLYQQAFRFFRTRGKYVHVKQDWDNGKLLGYEGIIEDKEGSIDCGTFNTYELAEMSCLSYLIESETDAHPLSLMINNEYILTNHEEGSGTGVLIYNQVNFKKELKELEVDEADFPSINWNFEYHKMYVENGHVMNIEAIKDQEHLSAWLKEFDRGSRHSLRVYKY